MPTKADRKHLDATLAAFHSNYASSANWGNERWHNSLYPALTRPTRYAALVNQYVPRSELDKVLSTISPEELRPIQLPKLPSDVEENNTTTTTTTRPHILLLERVTPAAPAATAGEQEKGTTAKASNDEHFLFPPPQPTATSSNPANPLLTHWNMDAASALGAHMLDVQPGDRVLDLCAAPGGKSVALAQMLFPQLHAGSTAAPSSSSTAPAAESQQGCLHSNEIDPSRNRRLAANLHSYLPSRLFAANAIRVLRLDASDPRAVTQLPLGAGGYDKVLLDAPCSSERHVIHAHVRASAGGRVADEMARWRKGGSKGLAKTQAEILMTALRAARVGGRVVYSTCSVERDENDGVVDEALERLSEETRFGRIAVPDLDGGGGWGPLFFCVISKVPRKG